MDHYFLCQNGVFRSRSIAHTKSGIYANTALISWERYLRSELFANPFRCANAVPVGHLASYLIIFKAKVMDVTDVVLNAYTKYRRKS